VSSIWQQSGGDNADVPIHCSYSLVCIGFEEFGGYDLFYRENDTMLGADADAGTAVFDRFNCIFDLEVAAVGRKDRIGEIVTGPNRRLQEIRVSALGHWQNLANGAYHGVDAAGDEIRFPTFGRADDRSEVLEDQLRRSFLKRFLSPLW